jgi:ubiquinol-cytochrome c reductase cytochrome c subunit
MRKRLLLPTALVALAAALGIFVVGGPKAGAASPATASGPLTAAAMQSTDLPSGQTLFVQNCSSCHGINALGSGRAPNLQGVGAATVDLWLSAGWMPLAEPTSQPEDKPPRFTADQIQQIVDYVTSLSPGGVPIPTVDLSNADVATGFDLFVLNCAGCHTITGAGDELAGLIRAPSLHGVAPTQVAEAILTGPGNMPRFSSAVLSPQQVNDVVSYVVNYIQHPTNPGGLSLGGVGPVAEGFIGLFAGVGACMLVALWIGDRTERDEEEEHHVSGGETPEGAHA